MNDIESTKGEDNIQDHIYVIRGQRVMLDLTKEECLRSQIVTLNEARGHHLKYMPYAFTMLGTAILSSVLRSETAIQTNRKIMWAFVSYRQLAELTLAATYLDLRKQIEDLRSDVNDILADQNDINESTRAQLAAINDALIELQTKPHIDQPRRPIGFIQPKEEET